MYNKVKLIPSSYLNFGLSIKLLFQILKFHRALFLGLPCSECKPCLIMGGGGRNINQKLQSICLLFKKSLGIRFMGFFFCNEFGIPNSIHPETWFERPVISHIIVRRLLCESFYITCYFFSFSN